MGEKEILPVILGERNFFEKFVSPILTESGATGSGKTYMACAFGMEACKQYYTVKYVRLPDLLLDLEATSIAIHVA